MLAFLEYIRSCRTWLQSSSAVGRVLSSTVPLFGNGQWKKQYTNAFILKLKAFPIDRCARCIVDIGANVGLFSRAAEIYCPEATIIAAEPSTSAFAELSRTCGPRVIKVKAAVGASSGSGQLLVAEHLASSTMRPVSEEARNIYGRGAAPTGATEEVRMVTLAELLRQEKIERVDLLKIDVEGYEPEVLKGAAEWLGRPIQRIMMEVAVGRLSLDGSLELLTLLASHGYLLVNIKDIHRSPLLPWQPVANFDVWMIHQSVVEEVAKSSPL
jgi:FkbM family methyltransferase